MQLVRAMGMALVVMMVVSAIGCGGSDSGGSIVGSWTDGDETLTFTAGGSFSVDGMSVGTYQTSGSTLTINVYGEAVSIGFKVSGDKLTLSQGGESMVYTKV